jgi:beta-lactamase regulating signal transducer with metallopeptidase domain
VTGAALLAAYAAAAGFLAPAVLRRGWSGRAPRLAIGLWLALPLSWVIAVALAVLAATVPFPVSWSGPQPSGRPALSAGHAVPGGVAVTAAGLLLAAAVVLRVGACMASGLARSKRERRVHDAFLKAAGRPDDALGAVVLGQDAPAVYCLPGGRQRIVVSVGALAVLAPGQLQAVLAHERAHLRGRHHAMLATASALGRAFPRVPLLAQAGAQLAMLAEMAADDAAARRHDPGALAEALVILASAGARVGVLAAGGPAAMARIQRLLAPPPRPGRPARAARLATGAAALMLPAAIACLPLIAVACDIAGRT